MEAFLETARALARDAHAEVTVEVGDAERLRFEDHRFDAVVVALVLCSVPDVPRVLRELVRVLSPQGKVCLLEHVCSERRVSAAMMDLFDPLWLRLNGQGCHMNRRTELALGQAGLTVTRVEPFQLFTPGLPAFPMRVIEARPGFPRRSG